MKRARSALFVVAVAISLVAVARDVVRSTSFTVEGAVATSTTYDLARLQALPPVTQSVAIEGRPHAYVGVDLYALLASAGVTTRAAVHNDILSKLVVATGTDGYRVVRALGELHPDFGRRPDLVAYAESKDGVATPLDADGFARITAPGDVKGGRMLMNLASLRVIASASTKSGRGGGVATAFEVSGDVDAPKSFDLAALRALPSHTVRVGDATWTGVALWDLLAAVGVRASPGVKNDRLAKYFVATGSDGYQAAFSLGGLDPAFGNQPDLVVYEMNGEPLGKNGFARLLVPNDLRPGRRVANLVDLEVFTAP